MLTVKSTGSIASRGSVSSPTSASSHGHRTRRQLLASIPLLSMITQINVASAADALSGPEFTIAPKGAVEYLKRRDEAMAFQCSGGMMDCDGDRREFAKKQWEDFKKRDGKKPAGKRGPRSR